MVTLQRVEGGRLVDLRAVALATGPWDPGPTHPGPEGNPEPGPRDSGRGLGMRALTIPEIPGSGPEVHFPPTPQEPNPWDTIPGMSGRRGWAMRASVDPSPLSDDWGEEYLSNPDAAGIKN